MNDHPIVLEFIERMYRGGGVPASSIIVLCNGTKIPVSWIPSGVMQHLSIAIDPDNGRLVYCSKPISS